MPDVGSDRVSMHVRGPLELRHVHVARAHVFLLNVLPRPVYVHPVRGHGGGPRAAAATGATRRALGGARAVAAGARRSFWPLAAFCPAESCGGAARRSLRLERPKGYRGERLSQSGLMQLAWASLGAKRNRRVNNFGLADCKALASVKMVQGPQSANKSRSRRFGSRIGCLAAALMAAHA